jgi:hypothetical protein
MFQSICETEVIDLAEGAVCGLEMVTSRLLESLHEGGGIFLWPSATMRRSTRGVDDTT